MAREHKRDNDYWLRRLEKDGHREILAQVKTGQITVYKARKLAGYLSAAPSSPAGKLSYHWSRADHNERKRFVLQHAKDINRVLLEVRDDLRELKTKNSTGPTGK